MKLIVLMVVSSAAVLGQPPAKPGSVSGVITDAVTHQGIRHVTVTLIRNPSYAVEARTDDAGRFQIADLEPGKYDLNSVRSDGYWYQQRLPPLRYTVLEDHETMVNIEMMPLGTISGRVSEESGEPLAGAQVAAMEYTRLAGGAGLAKGAITDDRGEYRIYGMRPGRYVVRAWIAPTPLPKGTLRVGPTSGYAPQYFPYGSDRSEASPVSLPAGQEAGSIDFRLRRSQLFQIHGTFTIDESLLGEPKVRARPCGADEGPATESYPASLESSGRFEVQGLPAGRYCVLLEALGTRYAVERIEIRDRDVEGVRLEGRVWPAVPGTVIDRGGNEPLRGSVALTPVGSEAMRTLIGQINDSKFSIANVPAGDYRVLAMTGPQYLASIRYGAQDAPDGIIHVSGQGTALELEVGWDFSRVRGSVLAEDDKPVVGATVTIAPLGRRENRIDLVRMAYTDEAGRFSLTNMPPGDYQVFAWGDADVWMAIDPRFRAMLGSLAGSLTVTGGADSNVTVKLIPADAVRQAKEQF